MNSKYYNEDTESEETEGELEYDLAVLLSSLIVLRQKTHSLHWLFKGMSFMELHTLFQTQYTTILTNADRLAEFMRTRKMEIPASLGKMLEISIISEDNLAVMKPEEMIQTLVKDHKNILSFINDINEIVDNEYILENILADFGEFHSQQRWFLESFLE